MARKKRKDIASMDRKELISFFEELYEKVKLRNSTVLQMDSLQNDLEYLTPQKAKADSIIDFVKNNLIIKITFVSLTVIFMILLETFLEFLFGAKLPIMSFLLSIAVCGAVILIYYKRSMSKSSAIFILLVSAVILHIMKIVDVNDFFSTIVMFLLSALVSFAICFLISSVWYGINFSKYLSSKGEKNKEYYQQYEEKKESLTESIQQLNEKFQTLQTEINTLVNGDLHDSYLNEFALDRFLKYLKTGRCDNLKECANLYEEEMRQEEMDRYMKEARERELEAQQKELKIKEQMQQEQNQLFQDIRDEMRTVKENSEFQKEFTKNKVYKYGTNSDLNAMRDAEERARRGR